MTTCESDDVVHNTKSGCFFPVDVCGCWKGWIAAASAASIRGGCSTPGTPYPRCRLPLPARPPAPLGLCWQSALCNDYNQMCVWWLPYRSLLRPICDRTNGLNFCLVFHRPNVAKPFFRARGMIQWVTGWSCFVHIMWSANDEHLQSASAVSLYASRCLREICNRFQLLKLQFCVLLLFVAAALHSTCRWRFCNRQIF